MSFVRIINNLNYEVTLNDLLNFYKESINIFPELSNDFQFSTDLNILIEKVEKLGGTTLITEIGTISEGLTEPMLEEDMILYANYFLNDAVQWSWENCCFNLLGGKLAEELPKGSRIGEHKHCVVSEDKVKQNYKERTGKELKDCFSSDALSVYEHELEDGTVKYSAHCFSCEQSLQHDDLALSSVADELGIESDGSVPERKVTAIKKELNKITKAEREELFSRTSFEGKMYRGIKDEYLKFYGHLTEYDVQGNVKARYYPETFYNEASGKDILRGYKCRNHPKEFSYGKLGITGKSNQLSGQHKFKNGGKWLLVTSGEEDKVASYQMLREAQIARNHGHLPPVAVVSSTVGEGTAASQVKNQYEWINSFDVIVVGLDNDKAGHEATKKLVDVLPKEKVRIARWSGKDPNQMLLDGQHKQFVSEFYQAKEFISSGIIGSSKLRKAIRKELSIEKIKFPAFMKDLNKATAGGIPLGYIINLGAASGIGKTSIINELIYDWIFSSPHKVGVISLELDEGQYGLSMLSRHIGKKLQLLENPQDALDIINSPEVIEQENNLLQNEYGEDRWYLLDERDGSLDQLKKKILQMIQQYDCKFIILDPLQDVLDGYSNEDQAVFMRWMKQVVKTYKVSFFNINHVRKGGSDSKSGSQGRDLTEEDFQGSSAIFKSGGLNILIMRDKYNDDPVIKNTTRVIVSKCRWTGVTGKVGEWYYDIKTHTMHDKETFLEANPQLLIGEDVPPLESYEDDIMGDDAIAL